MSEGQSPGGAHSESVTSSRRASAPARLAINRPRQSSLLSGKEVLVIRTFTLFVLEIGRLDALVVQRRNLFGNNADEEGKNGRDEK